MGFGFQSQRRRSNVVQSIQHKDVYIHPISKEIVGESVTYGAVGTTTREGESPSPEGKKPIASRSLAEVLGLPADLDDKGK